MALIFAITHLRLLRLELITEKDKLFSLSLLQLGQRWISMTRCMFTALRKTYSQVKIDRTISADIKPSPEFAQGPADAAAAEWVFALFSAKMNRERDVVLGIVSASVLTCTNASV